MCVTMERYHWKRIAGGSIAEDEEVMPARRSSREVGSRRAFCGWALLLLASYCISASRNNVCHAIGERVRLAFKRAWRRGVDFGVAIMSPVHPLDLLVSCATEGE